MINLMVSNSLNTYVHLTPKYFTVKHIPKRQWAGPTKGFSTGQKPSKFQ